MFVDMVGQKYSQNQELSGSSLRWGEGSGPRFPHLQMMPVDRRVHRVPSSPADEDSKASLEGTQRQCARRGPSAGPLSRCGRTELSSFVVKKQTHLPREPVGRQEGGPGAHGFWGPGDFRSETPHHSHTGISADGIALLP